MEFVAVYLLGAATVGAVYTVGRLVRGWRIVTRSQRVRSNLRRM